MPGKRPRPFLRTSSRLQLTQTDSGYGSSPPHESGTKHVFGVPQRIVVGFDVVRTEENGPKLATDVCESPRSVLERSALSDSIHLHHHDPMSSPRSPNAVLEREPCHPPKGGIASGFVAAANIKSEELAVEHISPCEISFQSNPTTITDQNGAVHPEKVASRGMHIYTSSPPSYHVNVFKEDVAVDDAEEDIQSGGVQESIFCAASPFSNCCSLDLQTGDFLSVCFFCNRPLMPGKDIFMYRGDEAFCSTECRYQQIVVDELKERHPAGATYYAVASHDGQALVPVA